MSELKRKDGLGSMGKSENRTEREGKEGDRVKRNGCVRKYGEEWRKVSEREKKMRVKAKVSVRINGGGWTKDRERVQKRRELKRKEIFGNMRENGRKTMRKAKQRNVFSFLSVCGKMSKIDVNAVFIHLSS
uniref:Uncharacterized protein n=1 Tax=Octopus bimaculoides TaxID=37653 RepID=A0A0L8G495_OCTBM